MLLSFYSILDRLSQTSSLYGRHLLTQRSSSKPHWTKKWLLNSWLKRMICLFNSEVVRVQKWQWRLLLWTMFTSLSRRCKRPRSRHPTTHWSRKGRTLLTSLRPMTRRRLIWRSFWKRQMKAMGRVMKMKLPPQPHQRLLSQMLVVTGPPLRIKRRGTKRRRDEWAWVLAWKQPQVQCSTG